MVDICRAAKRQGKYPPLSPTPRGIIVLVYTTQVEKIVAIFTFPCFLLWERKVIPTLFTYSFLRVFVIHELEHLHDTRA